ncbi:hypothetical protein Fot_37484 [Forsythia ovata]|uniref:Uncharacterized protein n=1 Tax=Forsythia ovata TaxID=205694 RepID=A0ABD1RZ87_9LAMI
MMELLSASSAIMVASVYNGQRRTIGYVKTGRDVYLSEAHELRLENKILRSRLAVSEDARAKAEYKISMDETLQKLYVKARKQAELKLKVCENMAHAKHKELTEALAELSMANELLAKLEVSSYTDPKGSADM